MKSFIFFLFCQPLEQIKLEIQALLLYYNGVVYGVGRFDQIDLVIFVILLVRPPNTKKIQFWRDYNDCQMGKSRN